MTEVKLLVISQVVSVAFIHWLEAFSQEHGPVELWTGTEVAAYSDHIHVRRLTPYNKDTYRTRLLTWIRFSTAVMIMLIFRHRRIPVLAITNPPFMPLILVLHRIFFGRLYGIIEYDIYPQIMVAMGLLTERSLIYRIWWTWHAWSLRRANILVTLSDLMATELEIMAQRQLTQLVVIPTWTNLSRIKPLPRAENPFARDHLPFADLVALYSGNLGATHAIETIINVAEHMTHESQVQFLIIGNGAKYAQVEESIASGRTPNIMLLPLQPVEVVPYSLASADFAFVTLAAGYERLSLPSKTYDMMAAGCVVIGVSPVGSGLATLLSRHVCGKNFTPDKVHEIASWILELANNRSQMHEFQQAARKAAEEHFSAERCEPMLSTAVRKYLINAQLP